MKGALENEIPSKIKKNDKGIKTSRKVVTCNKATYYIEKAKQKMIVEIKEQYSEILN